MAIAITPTHNVRGSVASAATRSFMSKAGKNLIKTVLTLDTGHSIELNGFGDKVSKNPPGTAVNFSVAESYGRWEVAGPPQPGLPELGGGAGAAPTGASKGESIRAGTRGAFPIKGDDYQVSIIRQNSLTNAVATVTAIINDYGAFTGTDANPAAAIAAIEAVSDRIIRLAYKYAAFSQGTLDTQAVQEVANKVLGDSKAV